MSKLMTQEQFVSAAVRKHGGRYDYTRVNYINSYTKVTIVCRKHGSFGQRPDKHLFGQGCRKCADEVRSGLQAATVKEFVTAARKVHGRRYIYTGAVYKNRSTPLVIICRKHGQFRQMPMNHLKGSGCPKCALASCAKKLTMTHAEFIKLARQKHGHRYTYLSRYVGSRVKMKIRCRKHGIFLQAPKHHIADGTGCPKCAAEERIALTRGNTDKFIAAARKVHGDRYVYDKTGYKHSLRPVSIRCRWHGVFKQTPSVHLQGKGCRRCAVFGVYRQKLFERSPERCRQPAILYVFEMTIGSEQFVKVGITTKNSTERRRRSFGKRVSIRVVREIPMALIDAFHIEQAVRQRFGRWAYTPKKRIQGNTECFNMKALMRMVLYVDRHASRTAGFEPC
jgi:Zn finger protein HypA/HybF involved in hydrogenase expression